MAGAQCVILVDAQMEGDFTTTKAIHLRAVTSKHAGFATGACHQVKSVWRAIE